MVHNNYDRHVKSAVDRVNELHRQNKQWPYGFCVGKVSQNFNMDYSFLMRECGRTRGAQLKRKKERVRKVINRTPEERYGPKGPYWNRD